jgi:hypothetical protein
VASTITQQSASEQGIAAAPGVTVLAPGGAPSISANPELVRFGLRLCLLISVPAALLSQLSALEMVLSGSRLCSPRP